MSSFSEKEIRTCVEADHVDDIQFELEGELINASGHRDQLKRGYGFFSIVGIALNVDLAWMAYGSTWAVAVANGGPTGVLYELLVACFYYAFIGASIAELASSIPSAGGVYHWASLTPGPRWGRMLGFFAGFINFFGWLFDLASLCYVTGQIAVTFYALYHPGFEIQQWHIFVAYVAFVWIMVVVTIFCNRIIPYIQNFGMIPLLLGGLATVITVVSMPEQRADSKDVWANFINNTGWPNGVAFLTGVLNGAFTIGTPDAVTHMAEELPDPRRDIPRAIAVQIGLGCTIAFSFGIACFYGVTDFDAVLNSNGSFPLAEVYRQCTNSTGATFGLLFIVFLASPPCLVATLLTVSRTWWALARDNATPFPKFFSYVNEDLSCPIPATILTGVLTTAFGAIAVGSHTAFADLVGSFVILTTVSYAIAILPHLLTGRKNVPKGWFWMGKAGYFVNGYAVANIILFDTLFCLPFAMPTDVETMNYNCVITVGVVALTAFWWCVYGIKHYEKPKLVQLYENLGSNMRATTELIVEKA